MTRIMATLNGMLQSRPFERSDVAALSTVEAHHLQDLQCRPLLTQATTAKDVSSAADRRMFWSLSMLISLIEGNDCAMTVH